MSWSYTNRAAAKRGSWKASSFNGGRVVLGCEHAGPAVGNDKKMHIVQNESTVMVRYIFVIPTTVTKLPISGHVAPAILSVFNSLRSGAL